MKKILTVIFCLGVLGSYAQNVGVGTTRPLSKLHVAGDLRIDSLASTKDSGIVLHNAQGVLRSLKFTGKKQDVLHGDGTFSAAVAAGAWDLMGNAGTDPAINFIGTTDNQPLMFRINNAPAGGIGFTNGNNALGRGALSNVSSGDRNTAFGFGSLLATSVGFDNTAVGYNSLGNNVDGANNTAVGLFALSSSNGNANVAIGATSMYRNTTGSMNTATGTNTLISNTTGSQNTALGINALGQNTTASRNTAIGSVALTANTTGNDNVGVGYGALLKNTTGTINAALGHHAAVNNRTGNALVAVGDSALLNNSSASFNTSIGKGSMLRTSTGGGNTAVGHNALGLNTTGINNTAVGKGADVTGQFSNATAIGYNAKVDASNKVRIGNASVTKIEGQVPFTTPSDGRYKYNVRENVSGLSFIMRLRPVTYQFDVKRFDGVTDEAAMPGVTQAAYNRAAEIRRTGFIAQEVETAAKEAGYNFSGITLPENDKEHYSLSYESFVVPLVKAVQEQQAFIAAQKKYSDNSSQRIQVLESKMEAQQEVINRQQQQIDQLMMELKKLTSAAQSK